MPTTEITQTTTTEVKLAPLLKKRLLLKLKTYEQLAITASATKAAQAKLKAEVEELFTKAGEFNTLQAGVKVGDFPLKHITPNSSRIDKKKLLEAGVSPAQLEAGTITRAGKGYLKITVPGDRDEASDE